jgi:hypothetical protein
VHDAVARALGKLGRYEEANKHLVQAVRLEHPQATETMRKLNMDYCRECHRPVYRTAPVEDADVVVLDPTAGVQCAACQTVFCVPCLRSDSDSILFPPCPRCGGGLAPMDRL